MKIAARLELGEDSHSEVSSSEEEDDEMSPTHSFDYDEDQMKLAALFSGFQPPVVHHPNLP
jgi:hypothetical protein